MKTMADDGGTTRKRYRETVGRTVRVHVVDRILVVPGPVAIIAHIVAEDEKALIGNLHVNESDGRLEILPSLDRGGHHLGPTDETERTITRLRNVDTSVRGIVRLIIESRIIESNILTTDEVQGARETSRGEIITCYLHSSSDRSLTAWNRRCRIRVRE